MNIIKEALYFPLKNSSLKMFFCLIGLFVLQYFITWLPIISIVSIVFLGYIYATQFKIIFTTGNGHKDAPDFPEFGDLFDSVLIPLVKVAGIWIAGFIPYILIAWNLDTVETIDSALLLIPFLYIPMGLMIAAMDDYAKAFNPVVVIQTIRAAGALYWVMIIAFFGLHIGSHVIETLFPASWIVSTLLGAYGIMFTGRLVGAVYRERLADDFLGQEPEQFDVDLD